MKKYVTKDGDRWDLIAYKVYGDPYLYPAIMLFNPKYMDIKVFKAGITLIIPELEYTEDYDEVSPPWQTD